MIRQIDLNADLGEGGSRDSALMQIITSCNIACGGHAGDAASMRRALFEAQQHNVCAGAHPAFPDREHFGRKPMPLKGTALRDVLAAQVRALLQEATDLNVTVRHLKPHGALYNMAAQDEALAADIVDVLSTVLPQSRLVGPPNSALQTVAERQGVTFLAEGFADRAYESDGQLRARSKAGSVLHEVDEQTRQALELVLQQRVMTVSGTPLPMQVNTLCVHGDTPSAVEAAQAIRSALQEQGVSLCAPD